MHVLSARWNLPRTTVLVLATNRKKQVALAGNEPPLFVLLCLLLVHLVMIRDRMIKVLWNKHTRIESLQKFIVWFGFDIAIAVHFRETAEYTSCSSGILCWHCPCSCYAAVRAITFDESAPLTDDSSTSGCMSTRPKESTSSTAPCALSRKIANATFCFQSGGICCLDIWECSWNLTRFWQCVCSV